MNPWKVAFFIVLVALLGSNVFWLYSSIDNGISYTYLEASNDSTERANRALGQVIVAGSRDYTKADILHLLRQAKKDALISEYPNEIVFEDVSFRFADGRLVEVGGRREP